MPISKADIVFVPSGRGKAQCEPDPKFPNGIEVDCVLPGQRGCRFDLPYPAKECGHWRVECRQCHMSVGVTAAGRADDPISIRVPCQGIMQNVN